nr:MAG: capsid protein [Crogonang virus 86]
MFRNSSRQNSRWTELERALGHRVSAQEQAYWDRDKGKTGFTLAGHNYEGPGNSLQSGTPVDRSDEYARIHDNQYFDTQWRYNEGELSIEEAEKEVQREDKEAIHGFKSAQSEEPLAGIAGSLGLQIKSGFERIFGHKYPDFPEAPHKHPQIVLNNQVDGDTGEPMSKRPKPYDRPSIYYRDNETTGGTSVSGASGEALAGSIAADNPVGGKPVGKVQSFSVGGSDDVEMSGSAGTGTAGSNAGQGGAPMAAGEAAAYQIERPFTSFGKKSSVYQKVHKVMTFGYADVIQSQEGTAGQRLWTNCLAEVPWHVPAFYLNQSEFNLIPNGSHIRRIHCSVRYRGATIQFTTNQTASEVAVLNQKQDIAFAHGLNRTGYGCNIRYTSASATQPMVTTGFSRPVYGPETGVFIGMVPYYYGSNNDSTTFTNIPYHQAGRDVFLFNYWCTQSRAGSSGGLNAFDLNGGWPCIASKITQLDGKTVVNQEITSSEYEPKMGMIKQPLKWAPIGLPWGSQGTTASSMPVGGNLVNTRNAIIINEAAGTVGINDGGRMRAQEQTSEAGNNQTTTNSQTFDIYTPIEKSQWARSGFWGEHDAHIQPSIHVGVQPVPALEPTSSFSENPVQDQWTMTRGYWEITATMEVIEYQPTDRPYAPSANVAFGEQVVTIPNAARPSNWLNPALDGATRGGMYTVQGAF